MKIEHPEPRIVCDTPGCANAAKSEAHAAAAGWLIDYGTKPHIHVFPVCREKER